MHDIALETDSKLNLEENVLPIYSNNSINLSCNVSESTLHTI